MNTVTREIHARFDQLETALPTPLAAPLRLQRSVNRRVSEVAFRAATELWRSGVTVLRAQQRALATVTGTARHASKTATTAAKTVAGQTRAQARLAGAEAKTELGDVAEAAADGLRHLGDTAVEAVEAVDVVVSSDTGPTNESYDDLTKDELYRRARSLDVAGRSQMSKDELIVAIKAAA